MHPAFVHSWQLFFNLAFSVALVRRPYCFRSFLMRLVGFCRASQQILCSARASLSLTGRFTTIVLTHPYHLANDFIDPQDSHIGRHVIFFLVSKPGSKGPVSRLLANAKIRGESVGVGVPASHSGARTRPPKGLVPASAVLPYAGKSLQPLGGELCFTCL